MFQLDDDPHHMHTDMDYFYYFLLLAVILVPVMLLAGIRVLRYWDHRKMIRKGNAKTASAASALNPSGDQASKK